MIRLKVPSLETGWLQRSEKWLPQPEVWLGDYPGGSGCYCPPGSDTRGTELDCLFPVMNGAIVIATIGTWEDSMASVLAHEWRHHWQCWSGWKYDGEAAVLDRLPYEKAIRLYFLRSRSEMDALLFERRVAHSSLNELFWDVLNTPQT